MTDQPFGAEGFDMNALLQQAQQMQAQMMSAQQELADATVDGSAGGGVVTVTVNGTGDLVGVKLLPAAVPDPGDLTDLEDLLVAAYRDAKTKAETLAAEKFGPLAGGLGGLDALGGSGEGDGPGRQLGF